MTLPPLRDRLKIAPITHEGKQAFQVQDLEHLFDHALLLPPLGFVVASFLDGRREAADVQAQILEHLKAEVKIEEIETVARDLEHHLLLETSRTRERRKELADAFANLPSRPARFV